VVKEMTEKAGNTYGFEERKEQLRMFMQGSPNEEIAKKFGRTVSAIEVDRGAWNAFLKGKLYVSHRDSIFYKPAKDLLLDILKAII